MIVKQRSGTMATTGHRATRWVSLACAGCLVLIGCIGFSGWLFDIANFRSVPPGLATMKANTAIAIFLIGLSLWLLREQITAKRQLLGRVVAWGAASLTAVTIFEYATGIQLGIDELLFRDRGTLAALYPGRMAPLTAVSLMSLAIALLLLDRTRKKATSTGLILTLLAGCIGLVATVGYMYSAVSLYKVASYTSIALMTSIAILVAAVGIICSRPRAGLMEVVLSDGQGGVMARRLLPIGLFAPVILGWLRLSAQRAGYIGTEVGLGLMVIAMTTLLVGVFLSTAKALDKSDRVRRLAEEHSRESMKKVQSQKIFHDLLESAPDAMVVINQEGNIVLLNAEAEKQFGYSREEIAGEKVRRIITKNIAEQLTAASGKTVFEEIAQQIEKGTEICGRRKDGSEFPIEVMLSPMESTEGNLVTAAIRDITQRRRNEREIRKGEERFRMLVGGVKDYAILMLDAKGIVTSWNDGAQRIKGYRADEIVGQHFSRFYPAEDKGKTGKELQLAAEDGSFEDEGWRLKKDGSRFWANVVITALRDEKGKLSGFSKVTRDITERKFMEDALFSEKERAQVTLNSIGDAVACTDGEGRISFLNFVAEKMTGWTREEAAGRPMVEVLRILDAANRQAIPDPMRMAAGKNETGRLPANSILIRRDGTEIPIEDSVALIHNRDGQSSGAVIVFRDVSAARAMVLEMAYAAQHDHLTGLPNRVLLNDRVNRAIALASRHHKKVGVLFLDLDGFKHVNDSLGHPIGDKLLQSIAKRLVSCVRGADTVSRQGGDEFVVLLSEMEQTADAAILARRILATVAETHSVSGHDLHVTTSIGVSVYPDDGVDAETLIMNADTAMYQAKEHGRQSYQFFKPEMNVRAVERQFIEESLRRALDRNEFSLRYQPKVNLRTGALTGAEALIRWHHPTRGLISPGEFIPVAEDSGLIVPIGRWVLREACKQARLWLDAGLPLRTMAVNISAIEFREDGFLEGIFTILKETGLDPTALELELTESVLMKHAGSTQETLKTLRARGVQVAVDDFGTGYSSLSYLRKFPMDALKIDQSFVRQISSDPDETAIVAAVISMGRSLKLRIVAEGVETQEQMVFLQAHHCDEAQGYYFGRPLVVEEFAKLLVTGLADRVFAVRPLGEIEAAKLLG